MPTVHRERGFKFQIYSADHDPPHVHAWKAGVYVRIRLGDQNTPPSLWSVHGMRRKRARRAVTIAERNHMKLLNAWSQIHGA